MTTILESSTTESIRFFNCAAHTYKNSATLRNRGSYNGLMASVVQPIAPSPIEPLSERERAREGARY